MSIQQTVSPTRFIGRGKPVKTRPDIKILKCSKCGSMLTGWASDKMQGIPHCCGEPMEVMEAVHNDTLPTNEQIKFQIKGSLNNNCIVVTWGKIRPEWLLLETFRGSQFIHVEGGYKAVFALAGDDAYAYCDKDPCKECSFRCKRGFCIYAYLPGVGLVKRPVDRILSDKG